MVAVVTNREGLTQLEIVDDDEATTSAVSFGQLQERADLGFCTQFRWDAATGRERIREIGTVHDHAKMNPVEHKGRARTYVVGWRAHTAVNHPTCVGLGGSSFSVDPTTENEVSILDILDEACLKEDLGWWLWDERVLEVNDWPYLGIQMNGTWGMTHITDI